MEKKCWYKEMAVYQIWFRSFCDGNGELFSPEMDVPEDEPVETFDTSDINDLDFSNQEDSGFELGGVDSDGDDEFHIPGFSDIATADITKKPDVATADFSNAPAKGLNPKNTPSPIPPNEACVNPPLMNTNLLVTI